MEYSTWDAKAEKSWISAKTKYQHDVNNIRGSWHNPIIGSLSQHMSNFFYYSFSFFSWKSE